MSVRQAEWQTHQQGVRSDLHIPRCQFLEALGDLEAQVSGGRLPSNRTLAKVKQRLHGACDEAGECFRNGGVRAVSCDFVPDQEPAAQPTIFLHLEDLGASSRKYGDSAPEQMRDGTEDPKAPLVLGNGYGECAFA